MPVSSVAKRRLRRAAPVIASAAVVITLVLCLIIAKSNDVYTGGLAWPYFSDLGRDSPGYEVFCVGLSIVAIALTATWYFNYQFQCSASTKATQLGHVSRVVRWVSTTCMVIGILSTIGLPILGLTPSTRDVAAIQAFCSTASCPSVHNNAAYWFFLLETVAVLLNTCVSHQLVRSAERSKSRVGAVQVICDLEETDLDVIITALRRTFHIQAICIAFFFVAFLLYFPIGLAVIQPFKRLTIVQCLERNLGETYCTGTMKYDAVDTKLWNYEDDYSASQIRAAAQLACILTLVGYSISFLLHDVLVDRDRVATMEVPTETPSTARHFCAIPILASPGRE